MAYKDPERRREYGREWMKRNPEKAREAMRRWLQAHRDEHRRRVREWNAKNPDKLRAMEARYRERHPEARQVIHQRRRARVAAARGSFTLHEWRELLKRWGGRCAYCGSVGKLQADHRVPLARGGANSIDNILPACGSCNRRKHLKSETEFRASLARRRHDA